MIVINLGDCTTILHLGTLLVDIAEDVLFSLLVGLNLFDRFDFGAALSLGHLRSAEGNFGFLLLLLAFD